MDAIELTDYALPPLATGRGLRPFDFHLAGGQSCAVHGDDPTDVHLFLRALATLERPKSGGYRFFEQRLDFSDYRLLLPWRRKISYIGRDSAMISNLTIRENLLLEQSFFQNTTSPELSEEVSWFCRVFNIFDKLDVRPAALNSLNLRVAIAIRELTKGSKILIMEAPEDLFGHSKFHYLIERIHSMIGTGIPFVYFTEDPSFIGAFSGKEVRIHQGVLREMSAFTNKEMDNGHGD